MQEDPSDWSIEKLFNIKSKKELDIVKKLNAFRQKDLELISQVQELTERYDQGVGTGQAYYYHLWNQKMIELNLNNTLVPPPGVVLPGTQSKTDKQKEKDKGNTSKRGSSHLKIPESTQSKQTKSNRPSPRTIVIPATESMR